MIIVNSLMIDDTATNMQVDVSTAVNQRFTSVLVWPYTSVESEALDITYLLSGTSENEIFAVSNEVLGVEVISGMYLFKFTTDEDYIPGNYDTSNEILTYVANTLVYHLCILDRLLGLEVTECGQVEPPADCQECKSDLSDVDMYLSSLDFTLQHGYIDESIKILNALDQMCEVCNTCPTDYGEELLVNGTGYGVVNNVIVPT